VTKEVGARIEPGVLVLMDNGYCSDKQKRDLQRDQKTDLSSEHLVVLRGCPIGLVSHHNILDLRYLKTLPAARLYKERIRRI
jgi:hypothetical protein